MCLNHLYSLIYSNNFTFSNFHVVSSTLVHSQIMKEASSMRLCVYIGFLTKVENTMNS